MKNIRGLTHQAGFTLVELMISLTVGLLISGAVASIYVGNRQTYNQQDALARMQENGRFAMQIIARDVQGAGYRGCAPIGAAIVNPPGGFAANFAQALVGNNAAAAAWTPALDAAILALVPAPMVGTDSDVITVRGVQPGSARTSAAPTSTTVVNVDNLSGLVVNDYAQLAVCNTVPSSTYFQIAAAGAVTLTASTAIIPMTAPIGSEIRKMQTTTYYIAQPAGAATPSLYRQQGVSAPEEIVENVAGMQILYGVDLGIGLNNATGDKVIDQYDTAAAVNAVILANVATAGAPCAGCTGWDRVRSVKINILVVSASNNVAETASAYTADGFNYAANRRLKQVFTTVVSLRNRTL